MTHRKKFRILEFIIFGLIVSLIEDLIAIKFATEADITFDIVWITFLVVIPFAIVGELIVDSPGFWHKIFRIKDEDNGKK
ncbi:MAG: hypothetical protein WD898_01270 [Candidatus Paceibacterota bacterium]